MINERDFHVFMLDGLRIDLHTDQPGRLILFWTQKGSILSDTRPAGGRCICEKDPTVLRLQQKQLVIKNLILMHLNLLQETYSSLEIEIDNDTAACVNSILKHQSCIMLRAKRTSFFSYFFGPSAHDEVRILNNVVSRNFKELNVFAGKETTQLAWLNRKIINEDLKLMDIFDFLVASQIELHLTTMTTRLNTLVMESLELVESQLNVQDTMNILKLLLKQYSGCVYLRVSNSSSRISSFTPKSDGVLEIRLFHQKVTRKEYLRFICNPIFNSTGVYINTLHHSSKERNDFKNDTIRMVESTDFIYSKVP